MDPRITIEDGRGHKRGMWPSDEPLCPDCGSSLRDAPTHPDGCRVCPECAAAWKLPSADTPFYETRASASV